MEKKNRQNLYLRPGIQASFLVVIFFVLTWIINEFENTFSNTLKIVKITHSQASYKFSTLFSVYWKCV